MQKIDRHSNYCSSMKNYTRHLEILRYLMLRQRSAKYENDPKEHLIKALAELSSETDRHAGCVAILFKRALSNPSARPLYANVLQLMQDDLKEANDRQLAINHAYISQANNLSNRGRTYHAQYQMIDQSFEVFAGVKAIHLNLLIQQLKEFVVVLPGGSDEVSSLSLLTQGQHGYPSQILS